jgi:hypothetical protein
MYIFCACVIVQRNGATNCCQMTTALRRRIEALREMTTERGCTEHEAAAARLAEQRIARRLGAGLDEVEPEQPYQAPPRRKRARRPREPMVKVCLAVGDIVDCCDPEGTFSRCRCGSDHGAIARCAISEVGSRVADEKLSSNSWTSLRTAPVHRLDLPLTSRSPVFPPRASRAANAGH